MLLRSTATGTVGFLLLASCARWDADQGSPACGATATIACPASPPTYTRDVVPILESKCDTTGCHDGHTTAWPLTHYNDVEAWADVVQFDVEQCTMPPLDGGLPLTSGERSVLLDWVACGAPGPDAMVRPPAE